MSARPTLEDWSRRMDPEQKTARILELLQANQGEIVQQQRRSDAGVFAAGLVGGLAVGFLIGFLAGTGILSCLVWGCG